MLLQAKFVCVYNSEAVSEDQQEEEENTHRCRMNPQLFSAVCSPCSLSAIVYYVIDDSTGPIPDFLSHLKWLEVKLISVEISCVNFGVETIPFVKKNQSYV